MIRLRRTGSLKGNQQTEGFQKQQICRWNFILPLFWSKEMTNSEVLQVKILHMWNPQLIAYKSTVFYGNILHMASPRLKVNKW